MDENPYQAPQSAPINTDTDAEESRVRRWRTIEGLVYLVLGVILGLAVLALLYVSLSFGMGSSQNPTLFVPIPLLMAILSVMLIKASRDLFKQNRSQ
jgi:hypothetical protein